MFLKEHITGERITNLLWLRHVSKGGLDKNTGTQEMMQQDAVMASSWTLIEEQELSLYLCCHMSHAGPKKGPRYLLSAAPFSTHMILAQTDLWGTRVI